MPDSDSLLERSFAQHQAGNLMEAAKGYRKFLRKNPQHAQATYLLGSLEFQKGKYEPAVDLLLEAIALDPTVAAYHHALALALSALENFNDASASLRRALKLDDRPEYHLALADILLAKGDSNAAAAHFDEAAALDPREKRAWYGGGCAELEREEFVPAMRRFEQAVKLDPYSLRARHNLARSLYELGQISEAFRHFQECAGQPDAESGPSRAMAAVIVPGVPEADNAAILKTRRAWVERDLPAQAGEPPKISGGKPLRIGYVSSFFQRDNWMKPVWGLINRHDRTAFQIHLFSDAPATALRHGYRRHTHDRFFDTSALSNQGMADLIREAGIDVLIDLNGYSNWRRLPLFLLRPAPVAVGWFNMYATTGMTCFDYLIGDRHTIPVDEEQFYTEKILRVPGSYLTFSVDYPVPPVAEPPCLTGEALTFGSLASQYKITNEVITAWSRILLATPNSKLLLKNKHLASSQTQQFIQALFQTQGIPPERLILEGPADHYEFLRAYDRIDLALDTFPYNGGTTTTEALWQGVPVIAFQGDRWAARTSATILREGGLGDFVADSLESYLALATDWGNEPDRAERLRTLRHGLRSQLTASSVCDTARFARAMEQLYLTVIPLAH